MTVNKSPTLKCAPASSVVSRAAPWAVLSPNSIKPAGKVHLPFLGSMFLLQSKTR